MKNANQIINSLQNKPQFSKLLQYKCINKIKSMFLPTFQRFVKFAYIKNNTLFFVLNHNAGKQEFDNSIQNIKSALNFYTPTECEQSNIQDIKAFVTHTPYKPFIFEQKENIKYPERSSGNFTIDIKDEKLHKLVKSIQKIIKQSAQK